MSKEQSLFVMFYERVTSRSNEGRKHLLGQVLTIVDASYPDPVQRKAIKDMVNDLFWGRSYYSDGIQREFENYAQAIGVEFDKALFYPGAEQSEEANPYLVEGQSGIWPKGATTCKK